jgi:hypothetical protein
LQSNQGPKGYQPEPESEGGPSDFDTISPVKSASSDLFFEKITDQTPKLGLNSTLCQLPLAIQKKTSAESSPPDLVPAVLKPRLFSLPDIPPLSPLASPKSSPSSPSSPVLSLTPTQSSLNQFFQQQQRVIAGSTMATNSERNNAAEATNQHVRLFLVFKLYMLY